MKARRLLICLALICILFFTGCSTSAAAPTTTKPSTTPPTGDTIKRLTQETIDAGVAVCEKETVWGSCLPTIRADCLPGVTLVGALVLHNGADAERLVTIRYYPTIEPLVEKRTGIKYEKTPTEAVEWVSIEKQTLRMAQMQTEVIEVSLAIPETAKIKADHWHFLVSATGRPINTCYQENTVITSAPQQGNMTALRDESILQLRLHRPLLQDSIEAIKSIKSDNPLDKVKILNYDPLTTTLTLDGFFVPQSGAVERLVTISYECGAMVQEEYGQWWLITML